MELRCCTAVDTCPVYTEGKVSHVKETTRHGNENWNGSRPEAEHARQLSAITRHDFDAMDVTITALQQLTELLAKVPPFSKRHLLERHSQVELDRLRSSSSAASDWLVTGKLLTLRRDSADAD